MILFNNGLIPFHCPYPPELAIQGICETDLIKYLSWLIVSWNKYELQRSLALHCTVNRVQVTEKRQFSSDGTLKIHIIEMPI